MYSPSKTLVDDKKFTASSIAFLSAALISPLILVMGKPLYGAKSALKAQDPFMVRAKHVLSRIRT